MSRPVQKHLSQAMNVNVQYILLKYVLLFLSSADATLIIISWEWWEELNLMGYLTWGGKLLLINRQTQWICRLKVPVAVDMFVIHCQVTVVYTCTYVAPVLSCCSHFSWPLSSSDLHSLQLDCCMIGAVWLSTRKWSIYGCMLPCMVYCKYCAFPIAQRTASRCILWVYFTTCIGTFWSALSNTMLS